MIQKESIQFLHKLRKNNNRDWFTEHKGDYENAKKDVEGFADKVKDSLNSFDVIEGYKLYRIYRDVRFSKDKTPYKSWFHTSFTREGKHRRGGYWLGIEPNKTYVGGGFYGPNKEDLFRIRKEFEMDAAPIRNIIGDKTFKKYFGELQGEEVKTAPKGFDKEHPNIDLIKKKQFYVMREFSEKEVSDKNFIKEVEKTYKALQPFFDYMSDVLTTDLNGEPI